MVSISIANKTIVFVLGGASIGFILSQNIWITIIGGIIGVILDRLLK